MGAPNTTLRYDPLGRLYEVAGTSGITRFLYDGDALVAEYNTAGTLTQRYLHGSAAGDDPIAWLAGPGVTAANLRHLLRDERGSIVAITGNSGTLLARNSYDPYGIPASTNAGVSAGGRFQYTGQAWIPEIGMYHYKARVYSPTLGRFLQTDPIGYEDAPNLYAYVGGDPINAVDPTGMYQCEKGANCDNFEAYRQVLVRARDSLDPDSGDYRRIDASLQSIGQRGEQGIMIREGGQNYGNSSVSATMSEGTMTIFTPTLEANAASSATNAAEYGASLIAHEADPGHLAPLRTLADRIAAETAGYRTEDAVNRALGNRIGPSYDTFEPNRETRIRNAAMGSVAAACRGAVNSTDPTCP